MSKPVSILSPEELARLKFVLGTNVLVRAEGKAQVVHRLDHTNFVKLGGFLSGKTPASSLKEGMKVFIIPDGSLSGSDITATCKRLKLKVTTDISRAQAIIGNSNIKTNDVGYRDHIPVVKLTQVDHIYYVSCDNQLDPIKRYLNEIHVNLDGIQELESDSVLLFGHRTIDNHYPQGVRNFVTDSCYLVSDQILATAYHALAKNISIVNDVDLFESIEKVVITEEVYETLSSMYNSSDRSDWETANQILYNCDYQPSKFYIWRLWNDYAYRIKKNRTKKYDTFYNACREFVYDNEENFIKLAAKENILPESYYYEQVNQDIEYAKSYLTRNHCYVNYDVKPKYTYEEFLKLHQQVEEDEESNVNQPI